MLPLTRFALCVIPLCGPFAISIAYADCLGPDTSENQDICQLKDFIHTDFDLNNTYQRLLVDLPPAQQVNLQKAEQIWVRHRDQQCVIISNGHRFVDFDCMTQMENAQTVALKTELSAPVVEAGYHNVYVVYGTSMPWLWLTDGLNASFPFGKQDGTGPIVITFKSLDARSGDKLIVEYIAGQYGMGPSWPATDANGYASGWDNSDHGSVATLPGAYMTPHPPHVGTLVGTFTEFRRQNRQRAFFTR